MNDSEYKARIAVLEAENAEFRVQVSRIPLLESENKSLREQVLFLGQKLSDLANRVEQMSVRKDSNNSSMPPSGDFRRKSRSLRTASGLKPGGQPGHKGTTLEMTPNPDFVAPLVVERVVVRLVDGLVQRLVVGRRIGLVGSSVVGLATLVCCIFC